MNWKRFLDWRKILIFLVISVWYTYSSYICWVSAAFALYGGGGCSIGYPLNVGIGNPLLFPFLILDYAVVYLISFGLVWLTFDHKKFWSGFLKRTRAKVIITSIGFFSGICNLLGFGAFSFNNIFHLIAIILYPFTIVSIAIFLFSVEMFPIATNVHEINLWNFYGGELLTLSRIPSDFAILDWVYAIFMLIFFWYLLSCLIVHVYDKFRGKKK